MKKSLIILSLCGMSMFHTGCDNYDDLIPQEYNVILSLKQSGEQDIVLYKTGEPTTVEITAMKTGSVPGIPANAKISAMSEAQFAEYLSLTGKNYKRLPDDCFAILNGEMNYAEDETYKKATVTIDFEKASQYIGHVIPVMMSSSTDSILSTKKELLLKLSDAVVPKVAFGGSVSHEVTKSGGRIVVPLNMQIDNLWDFDVQVALDPDNTTLPGVSLSNNGVVNFTNGNNGELAIELSPLSQIQGQIGLKVTGIQGKEFAYDESVHKLSVMLEKYPLTAAMLSTNAQEPSEGPIANVLDGDINTFFHTAWSVGVSGEHYFQVTLPEKIKHFAFTYNNRATNANAALYAFDLQGGDDEASLSSVGFYAWDNYLGRNIPWSVAGGKFVSDDVVLEEPVSVLRFVNKGSMGGSYFVWSEFSLHVLE